MAELIDPKLAYPQLVRKGYTAAVEIKDDEQAIIARISTDCVDGDGEVMLARGAITDRWQKNRVVMFAHQYNQPPIGLGHWIKKEPNGILAKYEPAPTEFAQQLYELYKAKVMKAFSVGFVSLESHAPTEKELKGRPDWQGATRIITKWELLEFSACSIGINPDALALAVGKGLMLSEETQKAIGVAEAAPKPEPETKDTDVSIVPDIVQAMELPGKAVTIAEGMKPFPNEHSCRLLDPGQFERFSRDECQQKHDGKCIDAILGIKEGKSTIQALRYKKDIWTAADARAHCKTREGSFEAAGEAERAAKEAGERQASKDKAFEQQKEIIAAKEKSVGHLQGDLIRAKQEADIAAILYQNERKKNQNTDEDVDAFVRHLTGRIT